MALARTFRADMPFAPRRWPFFYGWTIVIVGTLGVVMSIPGQTMGVSVFTDHLLRATGLTRLELSNAYLVGTVSSGLLLPRGGRLLDRFGARATALGSCALLGITLCTLSVIDRIADALGRAAGVTGSGLLTGAVLVAGFTALRFSGQGMLTMVSRTMLGKWFDRRRGFVSGLSSVFVSFGFASAPLLLSNWIAATGWRHAWLGLAALVGLGMGAVVWVFYRDNPEQCGLRMDGDAPPGTQSEQDAADGDRDALTRGQAVRTAAFWAVTLALSFHGLITTGFTFHIVDIGRAADLSEAQSVSIFLPMAALSTAVGYIVGLGIDRMRIPPLIVVMMVFQGLALLTATQFDRFWMRALVVVGFGASGGFFGTLSTAALPRFFGRLHLGAIAGLQMMCMVIASALGPPLLAASRQQLGSYDPAFYACCLLPAAVTALALVTRNPRADDATPQGPVER